MPSNLGNASSPQKHLSRYEQDFLGFLDSIFPTEPTKKLLIFDGTANQKVTVLMWMGDQVINSIRKAVNDANDQRKLFAFIVLEHEFKRVFNTVKVNVGRITESTSPCPEEVRKNCIEKCARIMETYHKAVENIKYSSSASAVSTPVTFEVNIVKELDFDEGPIRQSFSPSGKMKSGVSKTRDVQMTRIVGLPGSIYVSPKSRGVNIHKEAYADQHCQGSEVPFGIDLNKTYQDVHLGTLKNLTYVGAIYPDGTSLSYLPVKDVTLIRGESFRDHPKPDEGGVVELSFPYMIYDKIKTMCTEAFHAKYPVHEIRYPQERLDGKKIVRIEALARGYRKLRIINGGRTFHVTLRQALGKCSHNMTGDGLIHVRFDRQKFDDRRATMKVIFFGLQMVRGPYNHFQKIFRL